MEMKYIISIIILVVLLVLTAFFVTRGGTELVPKEDLDRAKACSFWVGGGCPDEIPSELLDWCENRYDCKERCGRIGIPTMGCE